MIRIKNIFENMHLKFYTCCFQIRIIQKLIKYLENVYVMRDVG